MDLLLLTCAKQQDGCAALVAIGNGCQGDGDAGVGNSPPHQQGRCHHTVLHQRVVPHERQHFVRQFERRLEALSLHRPRDTLHREGVVSGTDHY